jgi:hypothetical protein
MKPREKIMKMIERNKRKRERKGVVGNRKQRRRKEI